MHSCYSQPYPKLYKIFNIFAHCNYKNKEGFLNSKLSEEKYVPFMNAMQYKISKYLQKLPFLLLMAMRKYVLF